MLDAALVTDGEKIRRVEPEDILRGRAVLCPGTKAVLLCSGGRRIFVTSGGVPMPGSATAVSCGMSERDSVSVSALSGERAMLSVRRCLPVISGGEVCVQELALRGDSDWELTALRGGVLLCLGMEPEKLGELL